MLFHIFNTPPKHSSKRVPHPKLMSLDEGENEPVCELKVLSL